VIGVDAKAITLVTRTGSRLYRGGPDQGHDTGMEALYLVTVVWSDSRVVAVKLTTAAATNDFIILSL
jgi:hypothetical protein